MFSELSLLLFLGFITLQVAVLDHSSRSIPSSKWRDHISPSISFLLSLHLFFSSPCAIFIPFYDLVFFFFSFLISILFSFHLCSLNFAPRHLILCFSLCSLEENLHTYLTTWLSSCPMTIFIESHLTLLKNQKLIN